MMLVLLGCRAAFDQGHVRARFTTLPQLAEDEVAFDLLWTVGTRLFRGLSIVKSHLDPMLAAPIDPALLDGILSQRSMCHD